MLEFATLNDYRLKLAMLASIVVLSLLRYLFIQRKSTRGQKAVEWSAIPLVIVALVSFAGKSPADARYLNHHDTYHYYFGAKYSDVIDPFELYDCTAQALDEVSPRSLRKVKYIRDLRSYKMIEKETFLEGVDCKDHLPPERWQSFRADIASFEKLRRHNWKNYLGDKGYNATPVWDLMGHAIANQIPVEPFTEFNKQGVLDWIVMGAALIMAYAAFGLWAPSMAILMMSGCYELTSTFIRGSLLRLPWLALLVAGLSAIKMRKHTLAGILIAISAMFRVFPGFFLFGAAALAAREIYVHRRLPVRYMKLFGAAAITCGLLFGVSIAKEGSLHGWSQWAEKIEVHSRVGGDWRVGLNKVLIWRGQIVPKDLHRKTYTDKNGKTRRGPSSGTLRERRTQEMAPVKAVLGAGILGLLAWGISGIRLRGRGRGTPLSELEAFALSFPAIFVLVTPTFYYYCLLMIVVLGLAACAHRRRPLILLVATVMMEIGFQLTAQWLTFGFLQYIIYSFLLLGLTALSLFLLLPSTPAESVST